MHPPTELADITEAITDAILDVRYTSADNFTGQQLYIHQLAWLRHEPLEALVKAADVFRGEGHSLVIFDAFRSPTVQAKLRAVCSDNNYVEEVSNHCRGITVDITLADKYGVYLDMGSDYDDFSEKSHVGSSLILPGQAENRQHLAKVMAEQGFKQHPYEWWHFDYLKNDVPDLINNDANVYIL